MEGHYWTNHARLSGEWIVTTSVLPDGTTSGEYVSRQISAVTNSGGPLQGTISWPRKQPDGTYKFLTAVTSNLFDQAEGGTPVYPGTCVQEEMCSLTDSLRIFGKHRRPAAPEGRSR